MPVLPIAGFLAAITQHRINQIHEESEKEAKRRKAQKSQEVIESDFDRTVDSHMLDRMYELKKQTNEAAGIRTCAYLAAKEIDRDMADELLAELNGSIIHQGNYFSGDSWEWPLAAMEFKMEFCKRIFRKYGTCYWDEVQEVIPKKS